MDLPADPVSAPDVGGAGGGQEPAANEEATAGREKEKKDVKRGRPESWIHEHMKKVPDPKDKTGARLLLQCTYPVPKLVDNEYRDFPCSKTYAYKTEKGAKSTTGAKEHLINDHQFSKSGEPPEVKQRKIATGGDGTMRLDRVVKLTQADPRWKSFVTDLAKWCAIDGEAPNMMNHAGFQAFMEKRFPQFEIPSAPTITARLKEFSAEFVEWFSEYQKTIPWFGMTTDGWSSDAKQHYRTIALHFFVPGTWKLVAVVLRTGLCGGHDSDIASFLLDVMAKYKLVTSKVVGVTTDNANAEVAGVRLAELFRVACGCHLLNLSMKLVTREPKAATAAKPARPGSPVLAEVTKLHKFVQKVHNAPLLMDALKKSAAEWARRNQQEVPAMPTKPNNTRWNSTFLMIASSSKLQPVIDEVLRKHAGAYGLETLTADDWKVLRQVGTLLKPFKEVSVYMEGEQYPTVPEYLGRLASASYLAFYHNTGQVAALEPKVMTLRRWLCEDIGRRLWDTANDVTLVGLALHPVFKAITAPDAGIPQQMYAEFEGRNILTFFFRDLRKRMTDAILREVNRLGIKSALPPAEAAGPVDPISFLVPGYRRALAQDIRPEMEIGSWFSFAPRPKVSPPTFWDTKGGEWPLLRELARANFVAQGSNASSERVWSAADDVSGGDRSNVDPETLDAELILKKNTPVRALLESCSLFDALGCK